MTQRKIIYTLPFCLCQIFLSLTQSVIFIFISYLYNPQELFTCFFMDLVLLSITVCLFSHSVMLMYKNLRLIELTLIDCFTCCQTAVCCFVSLAAILFCFKLLWCTTCTTVNFTLWPVPVNDDLQFTGTWCYWRNEINFYLCCMIYFD